MTTPEDGTENMPKTQATTDTTSDVIELTLFSVANSKNTLLSDLIMSLKLDLTNSDQLHC